MDTLPSGSTPTAAVESQQLRRYEELVPAFRRHVSPGSVDSAIYPDMAPYTPHRGLPSDTPDPEIPGMRPPERILGNRRPDVISSLGMGALQAEHVLTNEIALSGMIATAENTLMMYGRWQQRPEDYGSMGVEDLYNSVTLYDPKTGRFTNVEGQQRSYVNGVDGRILVTDQTPRPLGRSLTVEDHKRRWAPDYIPQVVFDSRIGQVDERYGKVPNNPVAVETWNTLMARSVPVPPEAVHEYTDIMLDSANRTARLQQFNERALAEAVRPAGGVE